MAKKDVAAIQVLVDSLTFGGSNFNAGDVVLEATDEMLACADEKRKSGEGKLLCKRLTAQEALKAAKRADAGDESVVVAEVPEEEPVVVEEDLGEE